MDVIIIIIIGRGILSSLCVCGLCVELIRQRTLLLYRQSIIRCRQREKKGERMHKQRKKPAKCNITREKKGGSSIKRKHVDNKGKKERNHVMFECFKRKDKTIEVLLKHLLRQGEHIMATVNEVQAQANALTDAFTAEQARQAAKNGALQSQIDAGVAALAAIQAELDALKNGGQTPENQAIIDDISAKVVNVTNGLNGSAV